MFLFSLLSDARVLDILILFLITIKREAESGLVLQMEEIGQEQSSALSEPWLCCRFKPNDLAINICLYPPVSCSILLGLSPERRSVEKTTCALKLC